MESGRGKARVVDGGREREGEREEVMMSGKEAKTGAALSYSKGAIPLPIHSMWEPGASCGK
eukprot:341905-Chlamydomonas_euryale.AAC.2